jgi:hypothetical protein
MALENTKTDFFTDLVTFDVESGLQEPRASTTPDKHPFNEDPSLDVLKYSTSVSQLQSEGNLYYRAPFGLNGRELLSSEEIAANLKVTKVNIHKDQNYPDVKTQFT